ncbi:MAG: branched-chain amino acid ABC transporter permease [Acidimicrobiia bacterium]|nr:branched-chain amino acid ABC transporter permease [Acidimicrobiia bacterium]MDH4308262.1 branched-chain amino acid ABC transporter permease [Acidimicrobiia bacterium]MDH5292050.1 branched-chain amino acid ABC transporter permease [Acidimicrobiia bacterium]
MTDTLILAQATVGGIEQFWQMVVGGLALGTIYALLAMGFVIIFKATQVVNFAHGALVAVGAFLVALTAVEIDVPGRWIPSAPTWVTWALAAVLGVALGGAAGMVLERLFIRPMVGEPLFQIAILTVGLDIVLRTIVDDFAGLDGRPLADPWGTATATIGPVTVPHTQLVQLGVTVVAVVAVALFFRSRTGVAMRATAFDQEAARAQGITVGRIFGLSWLLGAVLAGVAGIFASIFPRAAGVSSATAFVAFGAFPAIILGGLDSIVGAIVGGIVIGLAESAASVYLTGFSNVLGSGFSAIIGYVIMLLVLLIRPYGLFGTEEVRRV